MPREAVREISRSLNVIGARIALQQASAKAMMRFGSFSDTRIKPNWSPDSRATVSCGLRRRPSRRASVNRIESPTAMPTESLTCLKRSTSITITVGRRSELLLARPSTASRRSAKSCRFGKPVRLSCTASWSRRSSAILVSLTSVKVPTSRITSPSEPTTGRAFMVNHSECPSGVRKRKSCATRPRPCSITLSSAARKRSRSCGWTTSIHCAAREGVLHDGEPDQHDDQHQTAQQGRRHDVICHPPADCKPRRADPGHQQEPGRNQQDGAVEPLGRKIDDDAEATDGHEQQRQPRNAGRDRGIDQGNGDERTEEREPRNRDMGVANVPATEIEICE